MKSTTSTLVLADDELSRVGLHGILANTRFRPIAAKGGWDAVVASGKSLPQVVVLILSGTGNDPDVTSTRIAQIATRSKVVVLADQCEASLVRRAICAGAVAFLPRSISTTILMQVLELVHVGEIVLPAAVMREVLGSELNSDQNNNGSSRPDESTDRGGRLSSREVEILKRLIHGDSNKLISRQLGISETTVKVHVKAILRKINVVNRTQAAIWGLDNPSVLARAALSDAPAAIVSEAPKSQDTTTSAVANLPRNGHKRF